MRTILPLQLGGLYVELEQRDLIYEAARISMLEQDSTANNDTNLHEI